MCNYENPNNFSDAMSFHGLGCKDPLISDENIHRFHVNGDKPGQKNGWYVFFGEVGVYGSWKTGEQYTWYSNGTRMSDTIRAQIKRQLNKVRSDNKVERRKSHLTIAEATQKRWFKSPPANPRHPYLKEKCVKPHGLRQTGNHLLIPLLDFHSTLWNAQIIYANGEKRFQAGGRVSGLFTPIGMEESGGFSRLIICEGWATGASLYEVMGEMVLCAMNAGNIIKVAQEARKHHPDVELIIAADNDRFTPGNPGLSKAIEAARLTQAIVMKPEFPEGQKGTDYNDAAKLGWKG